MPERVATFLMYEGRAEEALEVYRSLFADLEIEALEHFGPDDGGPVGKVKRADWRIGSQRFMSFDSPVAHGFSFTPAISVFIDCASEEELDRLFAGLSEGGSVLMPLDAYPFSRKFGWVADRFGVSWQLNLP